MPFRDANQQRADSIHRRGVVGARKRDRGRNPPVSAGRSVVSRLHAPFVITLLA
jgi:hypothetical protein